MNILVTGSNGFIARNLLAQLERNNQFTVSKANRSTTRDEWKLLLSAADVVIHLAGENRPTDVSAFERVNFDLTSFIVQEMESRQRAYKIIYSSSAQAALDNPYGNSKRKAEEFIQATVKNGSALVYRLPGVFGKWCRPNYNSVVATYCYNVAHQLPVEVRDEQFALKLVYVDDVVQSMISSCSRSLNAGEVVMETVSPVHEITLGKLAQTIRSFRENRQTYFLPQVGDPLEKKLYSTYLTYLPESEFGYEPVLRTDERGSLFELLKSQSSGQIFVSSTKPGITRGNHFHHTKTEKFCVVSGEGLIQFRKIDDGDKIIEYRVNGEKPQIVDIPPGYTHNITNVGQTEMITLFWANEVFDPQTPDTYFEKV